MGKNLELEAAPEVAVRPSADPLADEVTELFEVYRAPLLRYLLSLGLPMAVGEEVVQEVFLSLYQHLRRGKPRQHLRGWLFRVGHNLGLKERLRSARRPEVDLDGQQACEAPNPEAAAAQSQKHRRLMAVVQALPAQDQRCLHLRAEGLRFREIAEVLNISVGSVAMALSRSLLKVTQADAL